MDNIKHPSHKSKCSLIYLYLCLMCSLFLLYFNNYYFNITKAKFQFFFYVTIVMILGFIILCIRGLFTDTYDKKPFLQRIKDSWRDASISDKAILVMMLLHTITTLLAIDKQASFDGRTGRYLGLLFTYMIVVVYYAVSRFYQLQQSILLLLLGTCSLVFVLGLLNFFYIDPFGFFIYLSDFESNLYISTIGNIDFYGILVSFSLPVSLLLYCFSEQLLSKSIYIITLICSSIGLITSNSDAAYLAVIVILALSAYYLAKEYKTWMRFLQCGILLFGVARVLYYVIYYCGDGCRDIHTLSIMFSGGIVNTLALGGFILFYLYCSIEKAYFEKFWNGVKIQKQLIAGYGVVVILVLLLIVYVNWIHPIENAEGLLNYIRFRDEWGTGRGEIWSGLFDQYMNFSLMQKFFGYGLDSTALLTKDILGGTGPIYDNAHNEYLQYLLTSGILGLCAYLILCGSICVRLWKRSKQEPFGYAIVCVLLAYMVQASVNLNQPMTTPLFFIFLAIAEAFCRHMDKEAECIETEQEKKQPKKRSKG